MEWSEKNHLPKREISAKGEKILVEDATFAPRKKKGQGDFPCPFCRGCFDS